MEKTMSVEEKIRRAEEIYNRRNGNRVYEYTANTKEKKKSKFMWKMIKQIIICFIIYGIFYIVTNRQYLLSTEFQIKIQEIVEQHETLNNTYKAIINYIQEKFNIQIPEKEVQMQDKENREAEQIEENLSQNNKDIGGAIEEIQTEEKSQEEKDVEEIKKTINFITPVQGTISSTFGWRNPTTASVPKYHTGLDIACNTGTIIKSATDGNIILASSEGDYGNHYKIQINDVIIIYAHCNKLYLKEGDTVYQGQEIGEVGTTGNSTGPHLHFEIRREERLVDPQLILDI